MTAISESALLASGWSKAGPEDLRFLGLPADYSDVMFVKRSGAVFARVRKSAIGNWCFWGAHQTANRYEWCGVSTVEAADEMFKGLVTGVKVQK